MNTIYDAEKVNSIVELGIASVRANMSSTKTYSHGGASVSSLALDKELAEEINKLAYDLHSYDQNHNLIFSIMERVIDDVFPERVMYQYEGLAETMTVANGQKPIFKQRVTEASKRRAKQFVTAAGNAGVYEVFTLDGRVLELPIKTIGGAAMVQVEQLLSQNITMSDILEALMYGIDETVYEEIAKCLEATIDVLQPANKVTENGFDEEKMDDLLAKADAYSGKAGRATIYCTLKFAAKILPNENWASCNMKDERWKNGYLGNYKGHNVVVLRQSYTDESNETPTINDKIGYILPATVEKPIKLAFEGPTQMRNFQREDWSFEIQMYKKMGIGVLITNNLFAYINTTL